MSPIAIPISLPAATDESVPIEIELLPNALAFLPKAIPLLELTLLPLPKATPSPPPVPAAFSADTSCILPIIANAANTDATTIFFLPVVFLAISDTTT